MAQTAKRMEIVLAPSILLVYFLSEWQLNDIDIDDRDTL